MRDWNQSEDDQKNQIAKVRNKKSLNEGLKHGCIRICVSDEFRVRNKKSLTEGLKHH